MNEIKHFTLGNNLFPYNNGFVGITLLERPKENTNTFSEGINGDYFYNTLYKFVANIGDITAYDFKILFATENIDIPVTKIPNLPEDTIHIIVGETDEGYELVPKW